MVNSTTTLTLVVVGCLICLSILGGTDYYATTTTATTATTTTSETMLNIFNNTASYNNATATITLGNGNKLITGEMTGFSPNANQQLTFTVTFAGPVTQTITQNFWFNLALNHTVVPISQVYTNAQLPAGVYTVTVAFSGTIDGNDYCTLNVIQI